AKAAKSSVMAWGCRTRSHALKLPSSKSPAAAFHLPVKKEEKGGKKAEALEDSYLQRASVTRRQPRGSSMPCGHAPAGGSGGSAQSRRSPSRRSSRRREDGGSNPERTAP